MSYTQRQIFELLLSLPRYPLPPEVWQSAALWVGAVIKQSISNTHSHPEYLRDDLQQEGLLALVRAASTFDPSHKVPFEHYARKHVIFSVKDFLRSLDTAPRRLRRDIRTVRATEEELLQSGITSPSLEILSSRSSLPLSRVKEALQHTGISTLATVPETFASGTASFTEEDPFTWVISCEQRILLKEAINTLPDKQRTAVLKRFCFDTPLKEIADEMGVSVSAVSQLCTRGIQTIRRHMSDAGYGPDPRVEMENAGVI